MPRAALLWLLLAMPAAPAAVAFAVPAAAQTERVDLALVLAVDVSESVDAARFTLQMDGIAAALAACCRVRTSPCWSRWCNGPPARRCRCRGRC